MRAGLLAAWIASAAMLPAAPTAAEVSGTVEELVNPQAPHTEWRRQPVPDAYVVMTWTVTIPAPAHATSSCRYSEIARADRNGRYSLEGPNPLTAGFARSSGFAYSPGLDHFPGSDPRSKDFILVKSARTSEQRLGTLSVIARPGCFDKKIHDPKGLLKTYLQSLLTEGRALNVQTREGKISMAELQSAVNQGDPAERPAPGPVKVVPLPARIQRSNPVPPEALSM